MRHRGPTTGGVVAAALATTVAACGSGSDTGHAHAVARPHATGLQVAMRDIDFKPHRIAARAGESITWTNFDDAPHNVTYVSGPTFTSSPTFTKGRSWTLTVRRPGLIRYRCTIHPGMDGSILVKRASRRRGG